MRPAHVWGRSVVVLVIGASLLLSGCSRTSQSELDKAKAAGASEEAAKAKQKSLEDEQARLAAEIKRLQEEAAKKATAGSTVTKTVPGGSSGGSAGGSSGGQGTTNGTSCGGSLSVGPNTSCAFAANVAAAFNTQGAGSVDVYSPVTGKWYTMNCVPGIPTICRGGNNAVVYIR